MFIICRTKTHAISPDLQIPLWDRIRLKNVLSALWSFTVCGHLVYTVQIKWGYGLCVDLEEPASASFAFLSLPVTWMTSGCDWGLWCPCGSYMYFKTQRHAFLPPPFPLVRSPPAPPLCPSSRGGLRLWGVTQRESSSPLVHSKSRLPRFASMSSCGGQIWAPYPLSKTYKPPPRPIMSSPPPALNSWAMWDASHCRAAVARCNGPSHCSHIPLTNNDYDQSYVRLCCENISPW